MAQALRLFLTKCDEQNVAERPLGSPMKEKTLPINSSLSVWSSNHASETQSIIGKTFCAFRIPFTPTGLSSGHKFAVPELRSLVKYPAVFVSIKWRAPLRQHPVGSRLLLFLLMESDQKPQDALVWRWLRSRFPRLCLCTEHQKNSELTRDVACFKSAVLLRNYSWNYKRGGPTHEHWLWPYPGGTK